METISANLPTRIRDLRSRWRFWTVIGLAFSVFAWTNWYFSPEQRFHRLVRTSIDRAFGNGELAPEDAQIWQALGATSADTTVHIFCAASFCKVDYGRMYLATDRDPDRYWTVGVEIYMSPVLENLGSSGWMPSRVTWRDHGWRWRVTTWDGPDRKGIRIFSGEPGEIAAVPRPQQSNAFAAYIVGAGQRLRQQLNQSN